MRANGQGLEAIERTLRAVKSIAADITVPLVANLKSQGTGTGDYEGCSVATEYFSENEASQILLGLQDTGFYTKLYSGETDFISAVLDRSFEALPRSRKIIYNTAQSGTGAGRKSLIPAFCALRHIPVCNSNAYVLSLARHKFHVYSILRTLNLPITESWLFDERGWLFGHAPPRDIKLIAKACCESASIGLDASCISQLSEEYEAVLKAKVFAQRQPYIVQRFISGYEAEVPVLDVGAGALALEPVAITLNGSPMLGDLILDYEIVEKDLGGFGSCDHLGWSTIKEMKDASQGVFRALGMTAIGRVDFRIDAQGRCCVTDVATTPHLIQHSSFAFAFQRGGFSHADLLGAVVGANARRLGWC
jgi:D-alanine-D-alanine ligase